MAMEEVAVGVNDHHLRRTANEVNHLRSPFKEIFHRNRTAVDLCGQSQYRGVAQCDRSDAWTQTVGKVFECAGAFEKTMQIVERITSRIEIASRVKEKECLL